MTDKTYEQELEEVKKGNANFRCKFTMIDVPAHLVTAFCSDVKSSYGNIYWVKLMDLMRKAEAYDFLMGINSVPNLHSSADEEKEDLKKDEDKEKKGIMTMGGFIPQD